MKPIVLPELLIEYLVVGSTALLWVLLIADPNFAALGDTVSGWHFVAFAPAVYALGMMVDFAAFCLVSVPNFSIKSGVRGLAKQFTELKDQIEVIDDIVGRQTTRRQVNLRLDAISLEASDLINEVAMRSSRDRIARGTLMNFLIALGVVVFFTSDGSNLIPDRAVLITFLSVFSFFSFAMWSYFEGNSYAYELRLSLILKERLESGF